MKIRFSNQAMFTRLLAVLPPRARVYAVGGTVRDALLGTSTKDADIVIAGLAAPTLKKHLAKLGKVEFVGARFGVFKVFPKGVSFHLDVALPRTERARNTGGKRDFTFTPNAKLPIEDDLSRRDFTVNAMAFDLRTRELVDPFGGQRDLQKKILRAVGKPDLRFKEDYSRLLRLLRFSAQLGFSIELKTGAAAKKLMSRLNAKHDGEFVVPREVAAEQVLKAFAANPMAAFDLFDHFGVFKTIMPEVEKMKGVTQSKEFHSEKDVFVHTRLLLAQFGSTAWNKEFDSASVPLVVVLAALFHDLGKPKTRKIMTVRGKRMIRFMNHTQESVRMATDIAERLKLSSYHGLVPTDRLLWLILNHHMGDPATAANMKPVTVAKYFSGEAGSQLMQLIWADQMASLRPNGKPDLAAYRIVRRRVRQILHAQKNVFVSPKPLVTGHELMRWFKLQEGPFIGNLLKTIEARQLEKNVRTKAQAKAYASRIVKQRRGATNPHR